MCAIVVDDSVDCERDVSELARVAFRNIMRSVLDNVRYDAGLTRKTPQ